MTSASMISPQTPVRAVCDLQGAPGTGSRRWQLNSDEIRETGAFQNHKRIL